MKAITTQKQVDEAAPKSAPYALGNNLYLNVEPSGSRQWQFIWKSGGKRRYAGLGSAGGAKGHKVSLVEARRKADAYRAITVNGDDPRLEAKKGATLFGPYALAYVDKLKNTFRNSKTEAGWRRAFTQHAKAFADMTIAAMTETDIGPVVERVTSEYPETGRHLRARIEAVFRQAKRDGLYTRSNPATRSALALERPKKRKVRHHPALPYEQAPEVFHAALPEHKLMMLTAARAAEIAFALCSEFKIAAKDPHWEIPAHRVKNGEAHTIPLTSQVLAVVTPLLDRLGDPAGRLFPGARVDTMLVDFKRLPGCKAYTQHGLRSTFRDWCGNETNFPRDIVEETYGHGIADPVEAAYRRGKALAKRRKVLEAWNSYLMPVVAVIQKAS